MLVRGVFWDCIACMQQAVSAGEIQEAAVGRPIPGQRRAGHNNAYDFT